LKLGNGYGLEYLVAHLVGDYLFQNDWMAKGKKRSWGICACHVLFYMLPFCLTNLTWWQLFLVAAEHWIQDGTNVVTWWMKTVGQKDFLKPPMAPWSVILVDNTFHLVWIGFVLWLGNP